MTGITVSALGIDRLVVCGDDGRRWVIDAPPSAVDAAEVRAAFDEIRMSGTDLGIPIAVGDLDVGSTAGLRRFAEAGSAATAVWRFAGRAHRLRLDPDDGDGAAALVEDVLRAGIGDPVLAAALVEAPLVADPLGAPRRDLPSPGRGVLERWERDAWVGHPLRPAPAVDAVTGILRRIVPRPPEPWHPRGFRHLHAELPHLASIDPRFQPDALAPAGAFDGAADTPGAAAVLSGIAHYCGAYLGQGEARRATAHELRDAGESILTVSEWRPHDPGLHSVPGFPFVADDDAAPTWWLAGDEGGRTCWAPLSLVHAGYLASGLQPLPPTNDHNLVGLQAGVDRADAADRAAAQVLAHDAVARWWRGEDPLARTDLPAVLRDAWVGCPLEIRMLAVPSATGVPVRLAVVDDTANDLLGLGFAAAADSDTAAIAAAGNALVQYASARDLDSPASLIRGAEDLGNGGVAGLAPHDPERRYAETAFADSRRLTDPMCHVQYGLSPASVALVRRRTEPRGSAGIAASGVRPYAALLASAARVVLIDVTTRRVREAGYAACRILAPDLERLTAAAFPQRIDAAPVYPGW